MPITNSALILIHAYTFFHTNHITGKTLYSNTYSMHVNTYIDITIPMHKSELNIHVPAYSYHTYIAIDN